MNAPAKSKKKAPKKTTATAKPPARRKPKLVIVGEDGLARLDQIKPNDWNVNKMSASMSLSLRHGLERKGWLNSQKLLIWRTDDKGQEQNIIIDGEHRWEVGRELGFAEAPATFLDGLSRREAEKLTIELMMKRGDPDLDDLAVQLRSFEITDVGEAALELGFDVEFLSRAIGETGTAEDKTKRDPAPESLSIVVAFGKSSDRNRVLKVLDGLDKASRAAAVLELCDRAGFKS
jgi:ParB-like chromosome segregation protein Spo0J